MRVVCEIEEIELEGDEGGTIPSIRATCSKCGNTTESYGTSEASVIRCLAVMREECPHRERNFYISDEERA